MNLELIEKNKMDLNKGERYIIITRSFTEHFGLGYGTFSDIVKQHPTCHPYRHMFDQYCLVVNSVGLNYVKSCRYTTPTLFIDNIYTINIDGIPNEILRKIMSYL